MDFPINMVIFHSYVSLPEGNILTVYLIPYCRGYAPCIHLHPGDFDFVPWPKNGQIDILDAFQHMLKASVTWKRTTETLQL